MSFAPRVLAILFVVAFASLVPGAFAQEEIRIVDASKTLWQETFDRYASDRTVSQWDIRVINDVPLYTLTLVPGPAPRWQLRADTTEATFQENSRKYEAEGLRLTKLVLYKIAGETRYAGLWKAPESASSESTSSALPTFDPAPDAPLPPFGVAN